MSAVAMRSRPAAPGHLSTAHGARLTVEATGAINWSPEDQAALDGVIDERPHVGAFLSPAWLSGLVAAPPAGFDPLVLVFRENGVPRGLVPLAIHQMHGGRARVALLGGGYRSDRVDLLAARGYEPAFSDMLFEWLDESFGRAGYVLELRDVPGDSALWGAIRRAMSERGRPFVLVPSEVHATPYLVLAERHSGPSHDQAEKTTATARDRRRLDRRGRITLETLQDDRGVLEGLGTLARLLSARWGAGTSVLDDARTFQFHAHVLPLLLAEGRVRMLQMRADGRPIAVCYMLAAGSSSECAGKWFGYFLVGYDREWAGRIHLARHMLVAAIELAEREGAREFDFLKGAERFKYYWPVRERTTIDATLYSGTAWTQARRAGHEGWQMAASLVKTVRGCLSGGGDRPGRRPAPNHFSTVEQP